MNAALALTPASAREVIRLGPQPGPQTDFLSTPADIAFYGGAAGGGKSYALLLEPLRHYKNPRFGAVIFRRNSTQVRNPGGLWDESYSIYRGLGAHPQNASLTWRFPASWKLKFAHLEHEDTVYDWQGAQIPYIGFDEVTHFSEKQFFYMMSRNRSTSGVPGYIRATCNPDVDSWVRRFIDWWIGEDGYPIAERSGKLRWFIRQNDTIVWGNSREEMLEKYGAVLPKSVTFIPSKVQDNKILLAKDPSYLSNLQALPRVERLRLEGGNWNVRAAAGDYFRREWFPMLEAIPNGWHAAIRFWDRAATAVSETNPDPDWTRGLLMYAYPNGTYLVADMRSLRDGPGEVEVLISNVASHDGLAVRVMSQQDPGSAGKAEAMYFTRQLAGYDVGTMLTSKDKATRAKPVSAQVRAGNVYLLRGPWNHDFFTELENFPLGGHDDQVDVLSGAFNEIAGGLSMADVC